VKGVAFAALVRAAGLALLLLLGAGPIVSPALAQEPEAIPLPPAPPDTSLPAAGAAAAPTISPDWWATVQGQIRRAEYEITWQEGTYLPDLPAAYQAPNRAHNLRAYFAAAGPILIPRTWPDEAALPSWRWALRLTGWGRAGAPQTSPEATLEAQGQRLVYTHGPLLEAYHNDEGGLEQSWRLAAPPPDEQAAGPLRFELLLNTDLAARAAEQEGALEFLEPGGEPVLRYGPPLAQDAEGRLLPASLSASGAQLVLEVDDAAAIYPLQVTCVLGGLPPGWNWKVEGSEADIEFGSEVATAGDVNGDGYSDLIVGAPHFDGGRAEQGQAYLFLGSRTGLSTTPAWTKTSGQAGAEFGGAVHTAGDLDGDGRAEVIVGARFWSDGQAQEGAAWIYYGTAEGLNLAPGHYLPGNQAGAFAGGAVGPAGDVNNDGQADVIVGAPYYDRGAVDEGVAWVWYGPLSGMSPPPDWWAESNQANAHLGNSVSTAGDVNGDRFADIIVGAPEYDDGQRDEGAVLVWHGLTTGVNNRVDGNPANAAWSKKSDQADAYFGSAVSAAGDVDGDGFAEVIVGAPFWESSAATADEGAAWVYGGSADGLLNAPVFYHECDQVQAYCGTAVHTAGDVNGDGYADVVIGAPRYTNGQVREGRAWVYLGSAGGLNAEGVWSVEGNQAEALLGNAAATAGDVNGDGYSDLALGAPGWEDGQVDEGAAYVYHGSPSDLSESPAWSKRSNQSAAQFGWALGTAGDVNGDGYADVAIGAPGWDGGQAEEGQVWVYLGRRQGLATTPAWTKESDNAGARFGAALASAGDMDGDGYDDLIVGAPGWRGAQVTGGGLFVYAGSGAGLRTTPLVHRYLSQEGAQFGAAVAGAGDLNGDGHADIAAGAPFAQSGGQACGAVWVYYGAQDGARTGFLWYQESDRADAQFGYAVSSAGDVNADGYSDLIVGAPFWGDDAIHEGRAWVYLGSAAGLRRDLHWHAESNQFGARLGHAVASAGDVNGDGYSDVIVGAPYWGDGGLSSEGKVWVYHGSADGLSPAAAWSKESGQNSALYGYAVACAGDLNGDGYADIALGAPLMNGALSDEGAARVYLGSATGLGASPHWRGAGGQTHSWYGAAVAGAGDVNGDGYADLLVGLPNYDESFSDEGLARLYYGNGRLGASLRPRQRRFAGDTPIARLGHSDSVEGWTLHADMRTPFGRGRTRIEFEVKPLGVSFNGGGVGYWGTPFNYESGESELAVVAYWRANRPYHWRIRLRNDPASLPWMPASRWLTMPWNGWNEADLHTAGYQIVLPQILEASDVLD
jgi:hypothetical protein